jgi:hypothetical protein
LLIIFYYPPFLLTKPDADFVRDASRENLDLLYPAYPCS